MYIGLPACYSVQQVDFEPLLQDRWQQCLSEYDGRSPSAGLFRTVGSAGLGVCCGKKSMMLSGAC